MSISTTSISPSTSINSINGLNSNSYTNTNNQQGQSNGNLNSINQINNSSTTITTTTYNRNIDSSSNSITNLSPNFINNMASSSMPQQVSIPNCLTLSASGASCVQCIFRYFLWTGTCKKVSDLCQSWNLNNGACVTCYDGYIVAGADCIPNTLTTFSSSSSNTMTSTIATTNSGTSSTSSQNTITFANCAQVSANGQFCQQCVFRYYWNAANSACWKVSDQCRSWRLANGACTDCYIGFALSGAACVQAPSSSSSSAGSGSAGMTSSSATTTSTTTITSNTINGIINSSTATVVTIPNCVQLSSDNLYCAVCSFKYYWSSVSKSCVKVNDLCKYWNLDNGGCTDCFNGYKLNGNICI